jgi:hypothetical protein
VSRPVRSCTTSRIEPLPQPPGWSLSVKRPLDPVGVIGVSHNWQRLSTRRAKGERRFGGRAAGAGGGHKCLILALLTLTSVVSNTPMRGRGRVRVAGCARPAPRGPGCNHPTAIVRSRSERRSTRVEKTPRVGSPGFRRRRRWRLTQDCAEPVPRPTGRGGSWRAPATRGSPGRPRAVRRPPGRKRTSGGLAPARS